MSDYNRYRSDDRDDKNYEERYIRREERRRQERLKRRRRNRIIIVAGAAAVLILIILILIFSVNSCASCSSGSTAPTDPTSPTSATEAPTQKPTSVAVKEIADNGEEGYLDSDSSLYFWDNKAFELFYGSNDTAKQYADAINSYKQKLGANIKVYDMVVPNHSEFGLCPREADRILNEQGVTSQRENTSAVYNNLSKDVKAVDIYDALNEHKTEYIYFNTDHHWTGLGAYYAYAAFAKTAGLTPVQLNATQKNTIDGFLGSLYTNSEATVLKDNPDHVDYYTLPGNYNCRIFMQDSDEPIDADMYYENAEAGSGTYGVFIWGDNPLTIIDNKDNDSGDKIALVKESYGNAFAPYLAYNYDEVHVIDFRYFDGNLTDYCKANGIKTVLFLNGVMSANTGIQISAMNSLFENSGTGSYNISASDSSSADTDESSSSDETSSDEYSNDYSTDDYSANDDQSNDYSTDDYSSDESYGNNYSEDSYSGYDNTSYADSLVPITPYEMPESYGFPSY